MAVVRSLFRGKVLGTLEEWWLTGQLTTTAPLGRRRGTRRVLVAATRQQWTLRIAARYPHGRGVMKYLARYVRGGPIKDHRFVAFDGQQVTFRSGTHRDLDGADQPQQAELTLREETFLRRWSEHVPLPGVQSVRAWGLSASTQQRVRCRRRRERERTRSRLRPRPLLGAVSGVSSRAGGQPGAGTRGSAATTAGMGRGGLRDEFKSPSGERRRPICRQTISGRLRQRGHRHLVYSSSCEDKRL